MANIPLSNAIWTYNDDDPSKPYLTATFTETRQPYEAGKLYAFTVSLDKPCEVKEDPADPKGGNT